MSAERIQMVDLHGQYLRLKGEIDAAMQSVIDSCAFINGNQVKSFTFHLADYLNVPFVVPCGNGTDALQIALMALELKPGDEVILPAFTYVAAVEVVVMLGMTPVLVDVSSETFNINTSKIESAISDKTKAIIVVHLFGQTCDMESVMALAKEYHLYVIEDNAQSMGADYKYSDGRKKKAGTIADIGTTSFFPSKPLACYGDGGALYTSDESLAEKSRMIANHGQQTKYHHKLIGCNSRLDTLQAAILDVKLKYMADFIEARTRAAEFYDWAFSDFEELLVPMRVPYSTHVFHQYTVRIRSGKRDFVQRYLKELGIPSMIYYPLPVQAQEAYKKVTREGGDLTESVRLCKEVLSLPMHTELAESEQQYIVEKIKEALQAASEHGEK
ncbi:MAG: DegT/DnrJ/EryC1/StrS family aminotransferase [Parabacteroides sp.]|jgi:Predicted pyridoxal phosphate-dependent enzyme apparently involved in regulation of cell wall biogenesis|nr:DegT/DnrJ/EryC1/StrS family aminotransferase [Parabacteroides sp.]